VARSRGKAGRRHPRSGRKVSLSDVVWILVILLVLAAVGAGLLFFLKVKDIHRIDAETLCPAATGPTGFVVVLLDLTDTLPPSQAARLSQELEREFQRAGTGTMISVGVVSEDPVNWGAKISLCKPLQGNEANELYQNPALIEERYNKGFRSRIEATVQSMLKSETESRSPIMEGLQAVLSGTPGFAASDAPKRIIVVSDLLQHSDAVSFYRGQYWDHFASSPQYSRLSRNLGDVDVFILRLPRPDARISDRAAVDDFWVRYFDRQGARQVGTRPLGDL